MKWVDLAHLLHSETPPYPGDPRPVLRQTRMLERDGYNAYELHTGLHAGTHVDLPMHLLDDPRTADRFAPELFCGRGKLLDLRGQREIGWSARYEDIVEAGDVVLLWTGFDALFHSAPDRYFSEHPVLTPQFAQQLAMRGVKMLGMDFPSPDQPPHALHRTLLGAGVLLLENLTGLYKIGRVSGFAVLALPLKLAAEASPVRAVAVLDESGADA